MIKEKKGIISEQEFQLITDPTGIFIVFTLDEGEVKLDWGKVCITASHHIVQNISQIDHKTEYKAALFFFENSALSEPTFLVSSVAPMSSLIGCF